MSTATYTITFSRHAVERFRERARPGLDPANAESELAHLVGSALVLSAPPAWVTSASARDNNNKYLLMADLILPLRRIHASQHHYIATTCIARGTLSAEARGRRTAGKRRGTRRKPSPSPAPARRSRGNWAHEYLEAA